MKQLFRNRLSVIFLIFSLGIVLPAGFLAFLGARSFQYERRLVQKETIEKYSAAADALQQRANEFLAEILQSLIQIGNQEAFERHELPRIQKILMSTKRISYLQVNALFALDEQGNLIASHEQSLSAKSEDALDAGLEWGPFSSEMERLDRVEFVEKDVSKALKGYQMLQSRSTTPAFQVFLLKNIASDYRKLGHDRAAEAAYLELIRRYDQVMDRTGYAAGVIGRQMLAQLYDYTGRGDLAFDTRMEILEGLILGRWKLASEKYANALADAESAGQRWLQSPGATQEQRHHMENWRTLRENLRRWQQDGESFAKDEWPFLGPRWHDLGWSAGGLFQLRKSKSNWVFLTPLLEGAHTPPQGVLVAVISFDSLAKFQDRLFSPIGLPPGVHLAWDRGDVKIHNETPLNWRKAIDRRVTGTDPPWRFQLFTEANSPQEQLTVRRLWIYASMTFLSLLMVLIGLTMMARSLRRETQIAQMKSDFVANVSHELRTPLTAITHISERLRQGRYRSSEEMNRFLEILEEEAQRLREIVENVLDFSKLSEGQKTYHLQKVDLIEVSHEAERRFRTKAEASGFKLTVQQHSEPLLSNIDGQAVLQAILNLLDNALKYSDMSREIELIADHRDGKCFVAVRDQGIGIDPEHQHQIFEKFYRVEHAMDRASQGGVGLGLAIVKQIVEGQNGRITLESTLGKGSIFYLWFQEVV